MSICVLCHDCKYWYDAGFNVPTCDGVICDQSETGCECCHLYRIYSPCPSFVELTERDVHDLHIAPNMDQVETEEGL